MLAIVWLLPTADHHGRLFAFLIAPTRFTKFELAKPTGLPNVKDKLEEPAPNHQRRISRHGIAPGRRFVDAALTTAWLERPIGLRGAADPDIGFQPVYGSGHQR